MSEVTKSVSFIMDKETKTKMRFVPKNPKNVSGMLYLNKGVTDDTEIKVTLTFNLNKGK